MNVVGVLLVACPLTRSMTATLCGFLGRILILLSLLHDISKLFAQGLEIDCSDPNKWFKCADSKQCVSASLKCDGYLNCQDGSDEANCRVGVCKNTTRSFRCKDGNGCVSISWKCDGKADCLDGSDENPTSCRFQSRCKENEFSCLSGACIPLQWVCDNTIDCHDKSDEDKILCSKVFSNSSCKPDEFECQPFDCIPISWVCDSMIDCKNGKDENATVCHNFVQGPKRGNSLVTSPAVQQPVISTTQRQLRAEADCKHSFLCNNGTNDVRLECIPPTLVCDGFNDCANGRDEADCTRKCPNEGELLCKLSSNSFTLGCITSEKLCDGFKDCYEGSDEADSLCQNLKRPEEDTKFQTGNYGHELFENLEKIEFQLVFLIALAFFILCIRACCH